MTQTLRQQIMSQKRQPKQWAAGDYVYWLDPGSMITEIVGQATGYNNTAMVQNYTLGSKHCYDTVEIPAWAKRMPRWKGEHNLKCGWFEVFQSELQDYKRIQKKATA